MNKQLKVLMIAALAIIFVSDAFALGGRSSGGFSSGSRSFSSSSFSSSRSSSSFSSSRSSATSNSAFRSSSSSISGGARGDSAKSLVTRFRDSGQATPKRLDVSQLDKAFTGDYRANRRTSYYSDYAPSRAVRQYVNTTPSYGMWDSMLMWSILDDVGDHDMYYNHINDPAFIRWHSDAAKACSDGDKDICTKLKALDDEVAAKRAKGVAVDPSYITPGIDPDIYEASNIDPKTLSEIKICTGAIGSDYTRYTTEIAQITKLKVKSIVTSGSHDNLVKMASGECDLAFTQNDVVAGINSLKKILTVDSPEVLALVCGNDSGINLASEIKPDTKLYVGSDQTGSQFTLDYSINKTKLIQRANVDSSKSFIEAANDVISDKKSCLFGVVAATNTTLQILDKSKVAHLVSIGAGQKFDGGAIITKQHFTNLTQEQYSGWTKDGTPTAFVRTSLVAPQSWIDQNAQLFTLLSLEAQNIKTNLQ